MIPQHIAIIMDGNGRWAKEHGKVRTAGHQAGAETLRKIVRAANDLGVKVLTVYAFSTENWKRPKIEVDFIMNLFGRYLTQEISEFNANNVQVRFIGSRENLSQSVLEKMDNAVCQTKTNTGIILNLAINYGGQEEILQAVKTIAKDFADKKFDIDKIDENNFSNYLYTKDLPEPDLLIRTGGDLRVSNFLLWQIAYAEIWTTEVFWPDFTPELLKEAISDFNKRERRFGGLNE